MKLPPRWEYDSYQAPFAIYTDKELVVSFQMLQPRAGEVSLHAAISRVSGTRPSDKNIRRVRVDFFNGELGLVEENNKIYACSELVRNLWQKVEVSVLTGDLLTPEMAARVKVAG
ncbi:MAG: hypothetical protein ACXADY_26965 [Candidatus Hodarchaeales archaeon]|jgi:hypothetical protein